jgi:hypothetical protein
MTATIPAVVVVLIGACRFAHGVAPDLPAGDAIDACAAAPPWWDPAYAHRFPIDVGGAPAGYTVQVDAAVALALALPGGNDLRFVVHDATAEEHDRELAAPLVEVRVPGRGTPWLYVGNAEAAAPREDPEGVFLFAESFDGVAVGDNLSARFEPLPSSEWQVADDGGNRVYRAAGGGRHPAAIRGLMLDDGEIRARVRFRSGGTQNHNGLAARGNSMVPATMDGFVGQLMRDVQRTRIAEYSNGVSPPVELSGAERAVTQGIWYALRLRFVGDDLELFVDDVRVATATRPGADGLQVGLFAHNCDVDYDDVRVRLAMEPEPIAMLGASEDRCDELPRAAK